MRNWFSKKCRCTFASLFVALVFTNSAGTVMARATSMDKFLQPVDSERVVLIGNKSFAEQVVRENTFYVVQHDFNLSGNTVTLPPGCVLVFDGGRINNGTLVGQNTRINSPLVEIFGPGLNLAGSWNIIELYADWFGAIADGRIDSTMPINKALETASNIRVANVILSAGTYRTTSTIYIRPNTTLKGSMKVSFVWSGVASTNILADFEDAKSFVISTYSVYKGKILPYNQLVSGHIVTSPEFTACPMCGVENIRINTARRVFGGIRFCGAIGFVRRHISITGVWYGFVTNASWNGGDEHCFVRNHLCSGWFLANDVNETYIKNCIAGSSTDVTPDEEFVFPLQKNNLSTTGGTYNNCLFAYYAYALYLENFCCEGGRIGKSFLQCRAVRDINPYDELLKEYLYTSQSSQLYIGMGHRDPSEGCKGLLGYGSSTIISEEKLEKLGIDSKRSNNVRYIPVYDLFEIKNSADFDYLDRRHLFDIDKVVLLSGTTVESAAADGIEIEKDLYIDGVDRNTSRIHIVPGWRPKINAYNCSLSFTDISFEVDGNSADNMLYSTAFNCLGSVKLTFRNCRFVIGRNSSIINNIKAVNATSGRVTQRAGSVIEVSFVNCTFEGPGSVFDTNCKAASLSLVGCTMTGPFSIGGAVNNTYEDYGPTM